MNANLIIRRIDSTFDIIGNKNDLKSFGFYNIIGYINIIKELNNKDVQELSSILKNLIEMDGIYKEFANHILNDGVLIDKFFPLDETFSPTEENLLFLIDNSNFKDIKIEELSDDEEKNMESIYEHHLKKEIKIEDNEDTEKIKNYFEKENEYKFKTFKENLDYKTVQWLQENIKKMSNENFGHFMNLITKIRDGE